MAKLAIKPGSTSVLVRIFIQDSASTTGSGKTGLTNTSFTSTKVGVARDDDGNAGATQVSLTAGTKGTWASGSIVEKDSTFMPGTYEFGLTNASLAAGSRSCEYQFIGTGIVPCLLEIDLGNDANVVSWNGTAVSSPATAGIPDINVKNINNVAAATPGAAGGIFIAGSNAPTSITGTSNSAGLTLTGQGTGPGILSTGGATGHGFTIIGGATSGDGINLTTTLGHGINATGSGATKHGVLLTGSANTTGGACDGAHLVGGFEGIGLHAIGGSIAASGAEGAKFEAASSNSNGLTILGFGTGHGLSATSGSGATGDGLHAVSVATNGDGFSGVGNGTGAGFRTVGHDGIVASGTANGAYFQSTFAGQGLIIEGTGAFPGLYVQGGGNGVQIQATGTAHHGLVIAGGDVTGDGVKISTTSGDAIRLYSPIGHALSAVTDTNDTICILANSGRGIRLGASGDGIVIAAANGHGISSTGGTNGDGFHGVGTGTGVGFRSTADAIGFGGGTIVIKKNTALAAFMFYMALASDNKSPALGLTITSTVALDGAAFGVTANSATAISGGWYKINLAAADLNGDTVAFEFAGSGANTTRFTFATQP